MQFFIVNHCEEDAVLFIIPMHYTTKYLPPFNHPDALVPHLFSGTHEEAI
jgi:hypothetical protein